MKKTTKKIVIGNWKMNPVSLAEAKRIIKETKNTAKGLARTTVVVCPPFVYASEVRSRISSPVALGAQDVWNEDQGSYTGEVSALMLKDLGAEYVIVGHSERRAMGERDEIIAQKISKVLDAGMYAVLCVGEQTHDEQGAYLDGLKTQIRQSLAGVDRTAAAKKLIVAYEPIWAIGAKEAMTPEIIQEMAIFVRKTLADLYGQDAAMRIPVLYGGSVNFRNAADIITLGNVEGLLVGRESVNSSGFKELLKAVDAAR